MEIDAIAELIPAAAEWVAITPLTRGIGLDKKYRVTDKAGGKFLLRLSDAAEYEAKKRVFELFTLTWQKASVPMPQPVEFGKSRDNQYVYMVLSWLEGHDFDHTVSSLTDVQYEERGRESGHLLRRIHGVTEPSDHAVDWEAVIHERLKTVLAWYETCGLRLAHDRDIIRHLEDNLPLMQNRPQTVLHNDYHIGNFILQPDDRLGIIDFDFIKIGDPWEDMRWMSFTHGQGYTVMANAQFHGYFGDEKPAPDFFPVVAYYAALGIFHSLQWQVRRRKQNQNRDAVLAHLNTRYDDFDGFRNPVPKWYRAP